MGHVTRECPVAEARRKEAVDELQVLWDSAGASGLWDSGRWLDGGDGVQPG